MIEAQLYLLIHRFPFPNPTHAHAALLSREILFLAEAKNERLRLSLKAVEKDIAGAENNVRIYSESMARGTNLVRAEFEAATSSLARLNEEKSKILAELGQAQAQAQGLGPFLPPGGHHSPRSRANG